jgi:hypothetical protein
MIDAPPQDAGGHDNKKPETKANPLLDAAAKNIKHLVFQRNHPTDGEVLVYVDQELDLEWECDDIAEAVLQCSEADIGRIQNGIASLEHFAHNWPTDLKLSTKRMLGEAIARVLQKDFAGADQALKQAKEFVKAKSQQVSRYWTLQACIASGAVAAIMGLIEIGFRPAFESALSRSPYLLSLCFWAGCLGALLFIILNLGKGPKVDSTAERHLHYLEGISRVVAGGIAGVLVGAMIKLGLFLPVFSKAGMESLAMCAAAMIAGASEKLAAGIITSAENNKMNQKEKSDAN